MMQFSDLIPNDDSFPSASSEPIRNGHGQQQQSLMAMDLESFDMQEPAVYLPQNTGQMQNGRGVQYPTSMMQMPFIGNAPQTSDNMHSEVTIACQLCLTTSSIAFAVLSGKMQCYTSQPQIYHSVHSSNAQHELASCLFHKATSVGLRLL